MSAIFPPILSAPIVHSISCPGLLRTTLARPERYCVDTIKPFFALHDDDLVYVDDADPARPCKLTSVRRSNPVV